MLEKPMVMMQECVKVELELDRSLYWYVPINGFGTKNGVVYVAKCTRILSPIIHY